MSLTLPYEVPGQASAEDQITNERLVGLMFRRKAKRGDLARLLSLANPAITRRMSGEIDWRVQELRTVARYLDTSVGYLLGETDDDGRPVRSLESRETSTASAVEASRDRVAANAFHSVPPEGFEPPTFGTGNQRSIP